jgi:tRNA(Ile)-lysidine synthase
LAADFPFSLAVAYFDHGLRPQESGAEVELARHAAKQTGWPFYHGAGKVAEHAGENGLSTEEAARNLRYAYLNEVLAACGAQKIAVAHTADDQAEELLLRLLRGTGRKGLAGMELIREGLIIRPFLQTGKAEILAYLQDKKLPFCTDSSNLERLYLRNRVRLDLLPYLERNFNPGIKQLLRQTAAILQEEENLLDDLSLEAYSRTVSGEEILQLDLPFLAGQPLAIQRRIIEKMLLALGNSPGFRQIDQILQLAGQGGPGGSIHLSSGLRGVIEGNSFSFSYPQGRVARRGDLRDEAERQAFQLEILEPGLFELDAGRQLEVVCLDAPPAKEELAAKNADYFDLNTISFPFTVRSRRPGDRFQPLGSSGHKKVGKFLTDLKLEARRKNQVPLVEYEGEVAALLGVRIAQRFRLQSSTAKVLRLRVLEK